MLAIFRRFLNTWAARVFFIVLVAAFGVWGVGDVIRNLGGSTAVATVAGQSIDIQTLRDAAAQQLNQLTQSLNGQPPTDAMRRLATQQALDQIVTQAAIAADARRLHVVAPDDAVRQAVFDIPAFRGPNGQFDHAKLEQVLQSPAVNLTEDRFIALMRADLTARQIMETAAAGVAAPESFVKRIFDFSNETRVADTVTLPLDAAPAPPPPSAAALQRWYDNHPTLYTAPEYRRIKTVVLSPQTVAKDVPVSDQDIAAYYEAHKAQYDVPEKRSADIVVAPSEDAAARLAAAWKAGADWSAVQAQATKAGATATALDGATAAEFPSPDLARAVFGAPASTVTGPVKTDAGWDVIEVTAIQGGNGGSLDRVRGKIRDQIAAERASDLVYDRAGRLQDLLGSGTALDALPSDLGVAAVTGTLDAQGMTPQGNEAPIPGPPALVSAVISAAFQLKPGDPPSLTEVPSTAPPGTPGATSSYYAVSVDAITPAALKPFDAVKSQVQNDWLRDAERHAQDEAATRLYMAVKSGGDLRTAALAAGLTVTPTPPVARLTATPGVPPQLTQILFGLKKGEPTMVDTGNGFVVAVLTEIRPPDPSRDPMGYGQTRDALSRALAADFTNTLAIAIRDRAHPLVNQALLNTAASP